MSVTDVVDAMPSSLLDGEQRTKLHRLAGRLDDLAVTTGGGRLAVSRSALRALLDDRDLFPAGLARSLHEQANRHGGEHLVDGGRTAGWAALVAKAGADPGSAAALRSMGITRDSSPEQVRAALRQHVPDIPEIDRAAAQASFGTGGAQAQAGRSVMDCCIAHLGTWAFWLAVAALGGLLIFFTATGPVSLPLAMWLIGTVGGGTAGVIIGCIANPNA